MPAGRLAYLLAALAVSGCGGAPAPADAQEVTRSLRSYLRAQANGDEVSACALLTDAAQQQLIGAVVKVAKGVLPARPSCPDAVGLVRAVAGSAFLRSLSSARVEHVQVRGSRASGDVIDGMQFGPQRVALQKTDGVWRIAGVPALRR
jgi:hypothetical protein